jgi:hypothetical protein
MPARRLLTLVFVLLIVLVPSARPARAHFGSMDNPRGVLTVPKGGSAWIQVQNSAPGDTIQWTWSIGITSAASEERVFAELVWTDSSGRQHTSDPASAGHTFGTFVAPRDFTSARVLWRNTDDVTATIQWGYGASAPFWGRPSLYLPAMIPIWLMIVAFVLGKAVDARKTWRWGQPGMLWIRNWTQTGVTHEYDAKPAK